MTQKIVLCADAEGDHTSQTRDASRLRFIMRSVLEPAMGTCKVWAVRDAVQGIPVDELLDYAAAGSPSKTCATLGFKADVSLGQCPYGSDPGFTACGFAVTRPYYKWSNNCDCGSMPDFLEKEGIVYNSHIPWDLDGAFFSRCAVR